GAMMESVKLEVTKNLMLIEVQQQEAPQIDDKSHVENVQMQHAEFGDPMAGTEGAPAEAAPASKPVPQPARAAQKVGRNDPCPCGSGKKYKHCHGKLT